MLSTCFQCPYPFWLSTLHIKYPFVACPLYILYVYTYIRSGMVYAYTVYIYMMSKEVTLSHGIRSSLGFISGRTWLCSLSRSFYYHRRYELCIILVMANQHVLYSFATVTANWKPTASVKWVWLSFSELQTIYVFCVSVKLTHYKNSVHARNDRNCTCSFVHQIDFIFIYLL